MANTVEVFLSGTDNLSPVLQKAGLSFGKLVSAFAAGSLVAKAAAMGLQMLKQAVYDLPKEVTMLNSRIEEMNAALGVIGKTAGYSQSSLKTLVAGVKAMGITTTESQSAIVKMIQANLDLSKSTDLARAAQDAAVIAQIDSSEALQRMIHGISTLQPEVLRNMGIIVNLEAEYKKYADSVDKTSQNLSANEKQQVAMNAVLEASTKIAGAYEAAMGTAGKQLRSLPRYIQEAWESLGTVTEPIFKDLVSGATKFFKELKKFLDENAISLTQIGQSLSSVATKGLQFIAVILNITKAVVQWIIENRELIKGMTVLAAVVVAAFKWGAITAGVAALGTAISLLPAVLGLATIAAKEFMVAIGPVGWIILGLGTAYTAYTAWLNKANKELDTQEKKLDEWQKEMQSSSDVIQTLNSDLKRYGDLLQYATQYRAAMSAGTIDKETYRMEMESLRQEILFRDAAAAKAKQAAESKKQAAKAAAEAAAEAAKKLREQMLAEDLKTAERKYELWKEGEKAWEDYNDAIFAATATQYEKDVKAADDWLQTQRNRLNDSLIGYKEYEAELARIEYEAEYMRAIAFHEWQMSQTEGVKEVVEKEEKELTKLEEFWKHTLDNIHDATANMFYDMLQGTADIFASIKNWFYRLLSEMMAMAAANPIKIVMSTVGGALGFATPAAAGTEGGGGGGTNLPPIMGGFGFAEGGYMSALSQSGFGTLPTMTGFSSTGANIYSPMGATGSMSQWGTTWGNIASYAGIAFNAINFVKALGDKQYGTAAGTAIGTGIGALVGGPIGAAIGGSLGGFVGSLFGGGSKAGFGSYTQGTVGKGKYGEMPSIGAWYPAPRGSGMAPAEMLTGFETAITGTIQGIYDAIEKFSTQMPAAVQKNFEDTLAMLEISYLPHLPGGLTGLTEGIVTNFGIHRDTEVKTLEKYIAMIPEHILTQLTPAFEQAVLAWVGTIDVSKLSIEAPLVQLYDQLMSGLTVGFGGNLDTFTQTANAFAQSMDALDKAWVGYEEQIQSVMNPLTELEQQLKTTNAYFDNMVKTLTELGYTVDVLNKVETDRNMVLNKIKSDATAKLAKEAQQIAEEAQRKAVQLAEEKLQEAEKMLRAAFAAETGKLNESLQNTKTIISDLKSGIDKLHNAKEQMRMEDAAFVRNQYKTAQSILSVVLGQARLGDLSGIRDIDNTLSILTNASTDLYSTFVDYQRDFQDTYNSIAELESLTGNQLSIEEQVAANIELQLVALNDQLNALLEINTNILSLPEAIANYAAAKAAVASAAAAKAIAEKAIAEKVIVEHTGMGIVPPGTPMLGIERIAVDAYTRSAIEATKAREALLGAWTPQGWQMGTSGIGPYFGSDLPGYAATLGFASGGYHSGGWRIVGERGPELEYTGASNIFSNTQSNDLLSTKELLEEIRLLRQDLGSQNYTIAKNTSRFAKLLERWDGDGLPNTRTWT